MNMWPSKRLFGVTIFVCCVFFVQLGVAQTWTGKSGGNLWNIVTNWDSGQTPGLGDTVLVQSPPFEGPILIDGIDAVCYRLNGPGYQAGENLMQVTGGTLTIANSWWQTVSWDAGPGHIEISGGTVTIGTPGGTDGVMVLGMRGDGKTTMTGGQITIGDNLLLGRTSTAAARGKGVWHHEGGTLNARRMFLGREGGLGILNISGGQVILSENILIGFSDGIQPGIGVVTVTGGALTLGRGIPDDLFIRNNGQCELNLSAEGTLVIRGNAVDHVNDLVEKDLLRYIPEGRGWVDVAYDSNEQLTRVKGVDALAQRLGPQDNDVPVREEVTLQWELNDVMVECDVYFGADVDLVAARHASVYIGTFPATIDHYTLPYELDMDTAYHWCIDSYSADTPEMPWSGRVWSFTTQESVIFDDMQAYAQTPAEQVWSVGGGGSVAASVDPTGNVMLSFSYSGDSSMWRYFGAQDWSYRNQLKSLDMVVYGFNPDCQESEPLPISVTILDANNTMSSKLIAHVDRSDKHWQSLHFALTEVDPVVDLSRIRAIMIEVFGDDSGTLFIDRISLHPRRCLPQFAVGDLTGDCVVDMEDLSVLIESWLYGDYTVYAEPVSSEGLLVHHMFDELGHGNVMYDASGNNRHTVLSHPQAWSPDGKSGGCIQFDGTFGVDIPDADQLFGEIDEEITITLWLYIDALCPEMDDTVWLFHGSAEDPNEGGYLMEYSPVRDGGIYFTAGRLPVESETNSYADQIAASLQTEECAGKWCHYAFVKNTSTGLMKLYVNGQLRSERQDAYGLVDGIAHFAIGRRSDGVSNYDDKINTFKIDDFRIYSRALLQGELLTLAEETSSFVPLISEANMDTSGHVQVIDFRDFVMMGIYWLEDQRWP